MNFQHQIRTYKDVLAQGSRQEIHHHERLLVQRVGDGDDEAFRAIAEAHFDRISRVALRIVRNEEDASDVAQEVLLSAHLHLGDFRADSQLGTWLHRVTCNSALMFLRRRRRHEMIEFEQSNEESKPEQVYQQRETLVRVQAACTELAPHHREILDLRVREDLSLKEIADSLKLSVPAAKSRIHRARLELLEFTNYHGIL